VVRTKEIRGFVIGRDVENGNKGGDIGEERVVK